jgi:glycosyltransferase involved in cell wall biosynthesis
MEIHDGKEWIHGNPGTIQITIFLITIQSHQLEFTLESINKLNPNYPVLVNVIMNVAPTNRAYNQMRERCKTPYFIQLDEDMELHEDAIQICMNQIEKSSRDHKTFLHTFKLIDTDLGVGNPPIIDCLKLYNNQIMQKYPTYNNGDTAVSSVDYFWHIPILNDGYLMNTTSIIIGNHGKHRSDYDIFLRYCKIAKSLLDPSIKTNSGHICKLLAPLHSDVYSISELFWIILDKFQKMVPESDSNLEEQLSPIISILNSYIKTGRLLLYNIQSRQHIQLTNPNNRQILWAEISIKKILCIVAILCVISGNYEYSFDKYPIKIYEYFMGIVQP